MKRLCVFLLTIVMVFCLIACSGKNDLRDALQGTWTAKWTFMGRPVSVYFTFKGDQCTAGGRDDFGTEHSSTESYKIEGNKIYAAGYELEYSYNKKTGEIILWYNDDIQLERGKNNVNYELN